MAEDCTDGDYLGAYSRFFTEFDRIKPNDQLPVSVAPYNLTKGEIVGEVVNITLQYLNKTQCPPSLQAHLVHQVVQEISSMCKKQPKDCGFKWEDETYSPLRLMQTVIAKINEICTRYLDNSRLALLPPPPCTPLPQVVAGGNKNFRRSMEDRYVVLHDLNATFGIQDDSTVNYYAVFDGHAGQGAAIYCANHLHQYLTENIYYPSNPEQALYQAFNITDTEFKEKYRTQKVNGGTTAVCTLIVDKKLYVAWVGDSTATLIKRDDVVQLVKPHRLHREDERRRIEEMGGIVMQKMGIFRVNGELSVSRAIGDVLYKPFVTASPETSCVTLDGTEDFLVLASDGLTDFVRPAEIVTILYHEIRRNPNGLDRAHHILLQWAKYAGSRDNITLIVVLLTPASEIAARRGHFHPYIVSSVNDILEEMNSKDKPMPRDIEYAQNAIESKVLKQTMISDPCDRDDGDIMEASNGKHENGDADYDYSDLGPETNVDAIDDVPMPVKNLSYEFYKDQELDKEPMDESNIVARPDNNLHEKRHEITSDVLRDEVADKIYEEMQNEVRRSFEENVEESKKEDRVEDSRDMVDEAGPMDYDDSPPSPQANKPLQHALIQEADNVADSEDSEDEWNYYRVDPNKDKDSADPVDEVQEPRNEEQESEKLSVEEAESPKLPVEEEKLPVEEEIEKLPVEEEIESKIQSEEEEVKCESPKEDLHELINTEISAEDKAKEFEEEKEEEIEEHEDSVEEHEKSKTMDFPLNPDAAEFIPISPQFTGTTMNLEDFPVSGSPFKQVPQMDDIQVPSQSEFEKEICQRPREVENEDKEYQNGDHVQPNSDLADYMNDRQKAASFINTLDDSEISSTKAEYGDTSVSFLTTTEFHRTGISTVDESFTNSERDYDIAKDPMAMSFTPSDFEAAFDNKDVDLNAVHDLSNSDLDEKNDTVEKEEPPTIQTAEPQFKSTNNIESSEDEHPPSEVVPEDSVDLVNLSSQQEESDATFIEHTDKPQIVSDFLTFQAESSPMEQQETPKDDHSPLTENYSAKFESEKEPVSVDNEQPLSPSSADIDETKPIDEASEDAALPIIDLQKETSAKETDTPSSLSPVPDVIDSEVLASVDSADEAHAPTQCLLHADAPEFTPKEPYSFRSFDMETNEVCRSPIEDDVCQMRSAQVQDTYQTPVEKLSEPSCLYQPYSTEAGNVDEPSQNLQQLHVDTEPEEKEEQDVKPEVDAKPAEGNLLNFAEEQQVCAKSPVEPELTPPISPREEVKSPQMDDLVCPIRSVEQKPEAPIEFVEQESEAPVEPVEQKPEVPVEPIEQKPEVPVEPIEQKPEVPVEPFDLKPELPVQPAEQKPEEVEPKEEGPMEADILEVKPEEEIEPAKEAVLNLSASMQEFTGLENELRPKAEEVVEPCVVPQEVQEVPKEEELKEKIEPEKPVEPIVVEEECKVEEKKEVEEVPSLMKEPEIEKAVEAVETVQAVEAVEEPAKVEAPENKIAETAAAAGAAATAVVVAAAATTMQSKAKSKTATKPAKTATSKTTTPKSTPTSPSKAAISSTRMSTATAKKSTTTATRPKDLDAPKKSTVSSTTLKTSTPKPAAKTTTPASTPKATTRTSTGAAAKPKTAPTTAKTTTTEKKATANGDVKPLSKPAAAKPASKAAPAATKTTLTKSSTTRTSTGTTTSKPRPATATTTTKTNTTAKSSTTTTTTSSSARPKTAPSAGSTTKTTRMSTSKAPMIDKQVKETANKQISMARTSTVTKSRVSNSTTTTTAKRVSSTTKTTTAASPIKKTSVTKVSGKTSTGAKTPTEKAKVLQNGVSEKVEMNTIIDDVPKKDLSPVIAPNDNQLIMISD
ncbi:uncharacterized protein LOC100882509 [Megachile rotundata]|uniref:uncharacterized protein LOC100882509 n=1 Tax=Megachile rotundata TaxID=143995 RepID=UPI003FD612AC